MAELLDPTMGYIFNQIFGQPEYEDVLIALLNALFKGHPVVESLVLKNTDIPKILQENKSSRLDVKATTDTGIELDIEIQCKNTGEIPARALHCTGNLFPFSLKEGESYNNVNVIAIWILGESVTERKGAISEAYMTFQPSKEDGYEIMAENERIFFIELPKFNPKKADRKDLLNAWLAFLQAPELMDSSWPKTKELDKAMDRLKYISADEDIRAIADARRIDMNNHISEMTTAVNKALEKAKQDNVKNLSRAGVSVEIIAQSLEISLDEVKAILDE